VAFNYLLQKKADVMITDRTEILYRQKIMPQLCAANLDHMLTKENKVYLVQKSSRLLLNQLNLWLDSNSKHINIKVKNAF
jgi:hypothetical protein